MAQNFTLDQQAQAEAAAAERRKLAAANTMVTAGNMPDKIKAGLEFSQAEREGNTAVENQQARQGGVNRSDTQVSQGGIGGFFGGKETSSKYTAQNVGDAHGAANQAALSNQLASLRGQMAPQAQRITVGPAATVGAANAGSFNTADQNQFRNQQMALSQQLSEAAAGRGPSAAQMQLQQGTDRSIQAAYALANSQHGGNPAMAMRQAQQAQAGATQQQAIQSAQLKVQEQAQARGELSGLLNAGRGADIGVATQQAGLQTTNAQLQQQAALANQGAENANTQAQAQLNAGTSQQNLSAQLATQQQRNDLTQKYLAMGFSMDQAQQQAAIQQNQFNAGLLAQQTAAERGVAVQNSAQSMQAGGAAIGAIGSLAAAAISDEREKTDITDGEKDLSNFLAKVGVHKYRYKDPDAPLRGKGEFVSPMAQELEQTKLGKSMVKETADGTKVVDYGKGFGALLAALSMHQKRLDRVEAHA